MVLSQRQKMSGKNNNFADFARTRNTESGRVRKDNKKKSLLGSKNGKGKLSGSTGGKEKKLLKKIGIFLSLFFLFSILVGTLFVIGVVSAYSQTLPNIDNVFQKKINEGKETVIVDRNGKELYKLQGDVVRERVGINDVPDNLKWAFLAAEDAEFYNHKGLNLFGLARAVFCYAKNHGKASCGGGSSITQQVIKNTTDDKAASLTRKIREAVTAMKAEQEYSKDQLLELYVNVVPMGGTVQGVKTASVYLYGEEDLNKLSLAQMAFLASIPNEPAYLSPLSGSTFDRESSEARAEYVLNRMLELRDRKDLNKTGLTVEQIQKAKEELPKVEFKTRKVDMKAPHYVNFVLEQLDEIYQDKVDEKLQGRDYLRGKGYKIITSLDLDAQEMLEENMKTQIDSKDFQNKIGAQTGAAVMMDPKTGELLALVGSKDFYGTADKDGKFKPEVNEAKGLKALGSTMKPLGYLSSFTQGYNPSSVVPDFQVDMKAPGSTTPYPILDYGGTQSKYSDPYTGRSDFITMRTALKWSLNIPAVSNFYLANYTNKESPNTFEDVYVKLSGNEGYKGKLSIPSAAIGGVSTRLIDQVHAFSTIASEGVYRPMKVVLEIKDDEGKTIEDFRKVEGKQVIDKKYTFLINDMNKHYWLFDKGGDDLLQKMNQTMDFGGKTGTSDNEDGKTSDVAFVAYSPTFVMGIWAGNSCGAKNCPIRDRASGEDLYRYLFKPFLQKYSPKITPERFKQPVDVQKKEVCNMTGRAYDSKKCTFGSHSEYVADLPKPEDMIETVSISQCGDSEKKASQNDKDLGLAQDKSFFVYKFPVKAIQDQINSKKNLNPPAEECSIQRNVNAPQVNIVSPMNGSVYQKSDSLNVTVFVTSDLPIKKVDIFIDDILQKSFTSGPYEASIPLDTFSRGSHKITAVGTDSRGNGSGEGRDEKSFSVGNSDPIGPTITPSCLFCIFPPSPTPTKKKPQSTPTPTSTVIEVSPSPTGRGGQTSN